MAACPSAHLHFCHFQFLHVGASDWHCLHPVQDSWLNNHCVDLSCGGTLLSHRTPDNFLQLFHPHCVLLFTSVLMSPSLCRVLSSPRYLNSVLILFLICSKVSKFTIMEIMFITISLQKCIMDSNTKKIKLSNNYGNTYNVALLLHLSTFMSPY